MHADSAIIMAYEILLPEAYHELNTPARGYLEGVEVRFDDGSTCVLTYLDPHNQEYYAFYFEGQNVIIVESVSAESIRDTVEKLAREGALEAFKKRP